MNQQRLGPLLVGLSLALVVLGAALLRVPRIATSATFLDEGARIAVGLEIAEGSKPYSDIINFGPPGAVLFNALLLSFSGASVLAVRIPYLLVSLLSLVLIFYVAGRTYSYGVALVAGLLFALSPEDVFYSYHAMSETLMVVFVLGALAAIIRGRSQSTFMWFTVAGALTFCAALVKHPGAFIGLAVGIAAVLDFLRSKNVSLLKQRLGGFGLGLLLLFCGWSFYLWMGEGWGRWFHEMTTYGGVTNAELHQIYGLSPASEPRKWVDFFELYLSRRSFMVLGLLGLILPFRGGFQLTLLRILAVSATMFTLILLPLTYEAGGHSHYMLMFEPLWIILSGGAIQWLVSAFAGLQARPTRAVAKALLAVCVVVLLLVSGRDQLVSLDRAFDERSSLRDISEQKAIADRIKGAERVLVLANPFYYFLSGTRPPLGRPLDFFIVYRLRYLWGSSLDEYVLSLLDEVDLVLVDYQRHLYIESVLERTEDPPRLVLDDPSLEAVWPRLYSVDRSGTAGSPMALD